MIKLSHLFVLEIYLFVYLEKQSDREMERGRDGNRERESCLLIDSSNACSSLLGQAESRSPSGSQMCMARRNPRAWTNICCAPGVLARNGVARTQTRHGDTGYRSPAWCCIKSPAPVGAFLVSLATRYWVVRFSF